MKTFPFSFWLTPAQPYLDNLTGLIQALCQEWGAVPFEPHVTLFVGEHVQEEDMFSVGEQLAQGRTAVSLPVHDIGYSDFIFKTLYIQFGMEPWLHDMVQTIRASLFYPGDYQLDPHLSLIYKAMETAVLQNLSKTIQLQSNTIPFDQIKLVIPQTGNWADIDAWQIVSSWRLTPSIDSVRAQVNIR